MNVETTSPLRPHIVRVVREAFDRLGLGFGDSTDDLVLAGEGGGLSSFDFLTLLVAVEAEISAISGKDIEIVLAATELLAPHRPLTLGRLVALVDERAA